MDNFKPKVSICIVTYNQSMYIAECLDSVISQKTNFDFEVIISDDCSTDDTIKIIERYAEKYEFVKLYSRGKNLGPFKNFIETHNLANGEYVCHLDGDDRWLPGKLQAQSDFLDKNLEFSVCWSRANLFNDSGGFYPGEKYDYSMFENGVVTFELSLQLGSVAAHSSIMYRRSCRRTNDSNLQLLDLYYTWEYLSTGKGKILDSTFIEYRVSSSGAMTKSSFNKLRKLNYSIASYYFEKYPSYKKSIFLFALLNFVVELKNFRRCTIYFLLLSLKTLSVVSVSDLLKHFSNSRKLVVPSLSEKIQID